jgi:hypothetical protein
MKDASVRRGWETVGWSRPRLATDSILFATPCYAGQLTEPFFHSAMRTVRELDRVGLAYDWLTEKNESLVHRGRMEMAATFLRSKHSHLFWIDADIEFEPEHVAALWNLQTDIACGVYAMKKRDEQWFAAWKDGKLVKDLDQFKGPIDVDYAGTGFLLIARTALEKIVAALKARRAVADKLRTRITLELALSDEEKAALEQMHAATEPEWEGANGPVPALFMTPIWNGGLESED